MKTYTSTEQDMQAYSQIISAITQLDMQRQEYMQKLEQWEKEHAQEVEEKTLDTE